MRHATKDSPSLTQQDGGRNFNPSPLEVNASPKEFSFADCHPIPFSLLATTVFWGSTDSSFFIKVGKADTQLR